VKDGASDHRFVFDLDRAIHGQLLDKLNESPAHVLRNGLGPSESGIYALYYEERLVYVGKASKATTKSGRTLRQRLNEHVGKISQRQNISLEDVTCRYLTFDSEWWVFAAEYALIASENPEWNYSGFGSKTPGRGRPGTEKVSACDTQFPPKE